MTQITLEVSDEVDRIISDIADRNGVTRGLAIGRALALLAIADEEQTKGNSLAIVDAGFNPLHRLVGIF